MHNAAFAAMGRDAVYLAFDVAPDDLMGVLASMRAMGFRGVNLTIPLKEVALHGLARLDPSAELLGAVNTVEFAEDGLVGHNTDGYGFLAAVHEAFGSSVEGLNVLVVGAGGAGRAVALTAASVGASSVALADLDHERVEQVVAEINSLGKGPAVSAVAKADQQRAAGEADFVVNATPIGMKKNDPSVIDAAWLKPGQNVFDLVYMYPHTGTTAAAEEVGCDTANGLGMLLHQGAKAFEIWTGVKPPVDVMRGALQKAVYKT
jgi:shikimate dehydrogenase